MRLIFPHFKIPSHHFTYHTSASFPRNTRFPSHFKFPSRHFTSNFPNHLPKGAWFGEENS